MQNIVTLLAQTASEGRVFGLDFQTFVDICMQLLNALILAVALTFILYKPVKKFLDDRTERIQSKIANADETMARANELIAEYESKISEIDKERLEILEEARNKAADETKLILEEARREAREIKQRSLEIVEADKKRLLEETRVYIIETASLIAKKYIAQNIDDEAQNKIFEDMIAKLEDSQWQL